MERAAILIGVKKTGALPVLQAVTRSIGAMQRWAQAQAFRNITVLTDENGPVEPKDIKRAVKQIIESGRYDQLLMFFSGHGLNIRYGEYWLLSDAPVDTQAAVNVDGSVALARYSGIPHVVLVSDCCRTAA